MGGDFEIRQWAYTVAAARVVFMQDRSRQWGAVVGPQPWHASQSRLRAVALQFTGRVLWFLSVTLSEFFYYLDNFFNEHSVVPINVFIIKV